MTYVGIKAFIDNPVRAGTGYGGDRGRIVVSEVTEEMRSNIAKMAAMDAKFKSQTIQSVDKAFSSEEFVHLPPPSRLSLKTAMTIHDMIESKIEQRGDDDLLIRATRGPEVTNSIETYMEWLEERIARG